MTSQYKLDTATAFFIQEDDVDGKGRYVACTKVWGGWDSGYLVVWKLGKGKKRGSKHVKTREEAIEFAKRKYEE